MQTPRDLVYATCSTVMLFIVREGQSERFDNFCLNAISINSVLVRFKVSLLADNQDHNSDNHLHPERQH